MNLADRIPTDKRGMDATRIFNILFTIGITFFCAILLFLLLQRVGIPVQLIITLIGLGLIAVIIMLSWLGRTMSSRPFFFAGRVAVPASIGLGGLTDWISGTFLILFFSTSLTGKFVLAPALMLGLFFQAALFSMALQKSGVSTLPGFLSWRTRTHLTGLAALLVVLAVLAFLVVAEFSIACDMLIQITALEPSVAIWLVVILAALSSLTGGWLSLVLVNGALATGVLICVLLPAVVTGFAPDLLRSGLEHEAWGTVIQPLQAAKETALGLSGGQNNVLVLLTTVLVLSAGFSVLPHALSRTTLNAHPVAAIESTGWSALSIFLVFSAMPLSIGLIGANPSSPTLALLLKGNPVLHILPYLAILFAAMNALSVTIFSMASAIVRASRRSRNLDPGEQSMFAVRLFVVAISLALIYLPGRSLPASGTLLVNALSIGAAGLFMPLVASIWMNTLPSGTLILSIVTGGAVVTAHLAGVPMIAEWRMPDVGAAGIVASGLVIATGRLIRYYRQPEINDSRVQRLRNPDSKH